VGKSQLVVILLLAMDFLGAVKKEGKGNLLEPLKLYKEQAGMSYEFVVGV
jgi:hypothetical protein